MPEFWHSLSQFSNSFERMKPFLLLLSAALSVWGFEHTEYWDKNYVGTLTTLDIRDIYIISHKKPMRLKNNQILSLYLQMILDIVMLLGTILLFWLHPFWINSARIIISRDDLHDWPTRKWFNSATYGLLIRCSMWEPLMTTGLQWLSFYWVKPRA